MTGFVCIENPPLDKALTEHHDKQGIIDAFSILREALNNLGLIEPSVRHG